MNEIDARKYHFRINAIFDLDITVCYYCSSQFSLVENWVFIWKLLKIKYFCFRFRFVTHEPLMATDNSYFQYRMTCELFFFLFRCSGLAGFFPLHPMTITEAERRRAQAELSEAAGAGAEAERQTEKPAEVWQVKLRTMKRCCWCLETKQLLQFLYADKTSVFFIVAF